MLINIFSVIATNPISKMAIRRLLKKENGVTKLEKLLERYSRGEKLDEEFRIIHKLINTGLKAFGGNEEELKEKLRDAYWRRGFTNVIRGIAEFGVKKPFIAGAPFLVVWDLTYACNLKCKHCYSTAGKPWRDELSKEEAIKAVDILADAGVTAIAFSGGEPLLRKDFFDIAGYASTKGMFVAVATNGTLITKEAARKIKEVGIGFVQISLDGTKQTHENFRGIKGIYDRVIEGIRNAESEGLTVCISTTATKLNAFDIPSMMDLAEELGVEWFMLYNFIPTGRGGFEIDLAAGEKEKLLRELWNRLKATGINFMSTAPYYARIAIQKESKVVPTHLL